MKIEIQNRFNDQTILQGEYESVKDCLEKNRGANLQGASLQGARLQGANLQGASLDGANLQDASLEGANLQDASLDGAWLDGARLQGARLAGITGYSESHDIFAEVVRRRPVATFSTSEWAAIGQIVIHRLCWYSIQKRFGDTMPHVFQVLAERGFDEWMTKWEDLLPEAEEDLDNAFYAANG